MHSWLINKFIGRKYPSRGTVGLGSPKDSLAGRRPILYIKCEEKSSHYWTTLLEVALSQTEDVHEKAEGYFEGCQYVQRVVAIVVCETPAYRAPTELASQTAETFDRSKLVIDPQSSECSYDGQRYIGKIRIKWQIWDRSAFVGGKNSFRSSQEMLAGS